MKLFLLMTPAYLFYWLCRVFIAFFSEPRLNLNGFVYLVVKGVSQLTFTTNFFFPETIDPGVYWYFGLTAQLYILYAMLKKLSDHNLIIIATLDVLLLSVLEIFDMSLPYVFLLRKSGIGWLACFIIGIILARKRVEVSSSSFLLFVFLLVLLALFSISVYSWMLPELFCVILFVLYRKNMIICNRIWANVGNISASIFAIHPILRYFWLFLPFKYDSQLKVLLLSILFFLITFFFSFFYDKLYKHLVRRYLL